MKWHCCQLKNRDRIKDAREWAAQNIKPESFKNQLMIQGKLKLYSSNFLFLNGMDAAAFCLKFGCTTSSSRNTYTA